jgi:hypothetical protein
VPYGGKKKGADTGIDGYYYCKPDGKKTEAGIVSVKGGETVHRNAVGKLRGVVEREKAPFGILITLRGDDGASSPPWRRSEVARRRPCVRYEHQASPYGLGFASASPSTDITGEPR